MPKRGFWILRGSRRRITPLRIDGAIVQSKHSGTTKTTSQTLHSDPHTQTSWRERAGNTFTTTDSLRKSKCLWGLRSTFDSVAVESIITEGFTNCCGNHSAQDHRAWQTGDLHNSGWRTRAMKNPHHPVKHFTTSSTQRASASPPVPSNSELCPIISLHSATCSLSLIFLLHPPTH